MPTVRPGRISRLSNCPLFIPQREECRKIVFIRNNYSRKRVFVNIPYRDSYYRFEVAICAALLSYGLLPVVVKNVYGGGSRICDICKNILSCKYGITDIWSDGKNMPFELGFMLAVGRFNLVFHRNRFKAQDELSDIQYFDPRGHAGSVTKLIEELAVKIPAAFPDASKRDKSPEHIYRLYRTLSVPYKRFRYKIHTKKAARHVKSFIRMLEDRDKVETLRDVFARQ